jgi:hypothetical protein
MNRRKYYWIVFTVSTLIYFGVLYFFQVYESLDANKMNVDAQTYERASQKLYLEGGKAHLLRPFFYPLLIGIPYLWNADNFQHQYFIWILHFSFWSITCLMIYKMVVDMTHSLRLAIASSIFFCLNIGGIFLSINTMSETAFTFFLTLSLFFFLRFLLANNSLGLTLCFCMLCLASLIRATTYPLCLFFLFVLLFRYFRKENSLKQVFISCIIFSTTIGLQFWNMHRTYDKFTFTYLGKKVGYTCLFAYAKNVSKGETYRETVNLYLEEKNNRFKETKCYDNLEGWQNKIDSAFEEDVKAQLRDNKKWIFLSFIRSIVINSISFSGEIDGLKDSRGCENFTSYKSILNYITRFQNLFYSFSLLILFPFFFYIKKKLFITMPKEHKIAILIIWLIGNFIVAATALSFGGGDRFHLVLVPLTLIAWSLILNQWNLNKS